LSRACLGEMISFLYINGAKSGVFRTTRIASKLSYVCAKKQSSL
jgi:hypothetical protein